MKLPQELSPNRAAALLGLGDLELHAARDPERLPWLCPKACLDPGLMAQVCWG